MKTKLIIIGTLLITMLFVYLQYFSSPKTQTYFKNIMNCAGGLSVIEDCQNNINK